MFKKVLFFILGFMFIPTIIGISYLLDYAICNGYEGILEILLGSIVFICSIILGIVSMMEIK